jgi:hypothetical protein
MWRAGGRGKQAAAGAPSTDRRPLAAHILARMATATATAGKRGQTYRHPLGLGHSTLPPAPSRRLPPLELEKIPGMPSDFILIPCVPLSGI